MMQKETMQCRRYRRRRHNSSYSCAYASIFVLATVTLFSFPHAAHSFAYIHPLRSSEVASPQHQHHNHNKHLSSSSSTRLYYKNFVDDPLPPSSLDSEGGYTSNFERRMRERFAKNGYPSATPSTGRSKRRRANVNVPPNVQVVETLEDYKAVVGDEKERLVVVRFYASWCMSCKAMVPSFYKLARSNPEMKFVEVPVTENNANLHQGLGVPSVPFGHVYHPKAGLVEERKVSRKEIATFGRIARSYVDGICEIPDDGDCSNPYE